MKHQQRSKMNMQLFKSGHQHQQISKTSASMRQLRSGQLKFILLLLLMLLFEVPMYAQHYSVGKNAHSHNDYLQKKPFYNAYNNGFASIEVDIFLVGDQLYVAHKEEEINPKNTIERMYIEPLIKQMALNGNGTAYKNGGSLQLMIDLKTSGMPTLRCLEAKLKPIRQHFDVRNNPDAVKLVITGDYPPAETFKDFDEIFFFDGKRNTPYTTDQLKRIAFFSTNFRDFSKWNGRGQLNAAEALKVQQFVDSVHQVGKPVRFWGNPDTKTCWQTFMKMGVDFLNTDLPARMNKFLSNYVSSK